MSIELTSAHLEHTPSVGVSFHVQFLGRTGEISHGFARYQTEHILTRAIRRLLRRQRSVCDMSVSDIPICTLAHENLPEFESPYKKQAPSNSSGRILECLEVAQPTFLNQTHFN